MTENFNKMKLLKVKRGFTSLSKSDFISFVKHILKKMQNNPFFSEAGCFIGRHCGIACPV
jgi:hypothetical protein